MVSIIKKEIDKILNLAEKKENDFTEEEAFNFLVCSLYCHKTLEYDKVWYEIISENITDGSNDGGIDFVYYDDDNSKVIIGQNKFSKNSDVNSVVGEIEKINHTINCFKKQKTSNYNRELKERYLNVFDRLNDENEGNIEIVFSSLSKFDQSKVISRVENYSQYSELTFLGEQDIEKDIQDLETELDVVPEFKFEIDRAKNVLDYNSDNFSGVVVNISASSLKKAHDQYENKGLLNLNIRRYIKAKNVDEGILKTINYDKDDFWFKNNGLTIACDDYFFDGKYIVVNNFSIVNGGQTTTLISKGLKSNAEDFFVMAKIVKRVEKTKANTKDKTNSKSQSVEFFNEIAEATNSQKPIQPRDLKSNSPEMITLKRLLEEKGFFLEIKRGISAPKKFGDKRIKNEELAQLIYSFRYQKTGTARSNKRSLFSNNSHYKQIFQLKYAKEPEKVDFLVDLIRLNKRVDLVIQNFKSNTAYTNLNIDQMNVLNNSKLAIIALMGYIYGLVNDDYKLEDAKIEDFIDNFEYGYFLQNYKYDDIDKKVEKLIFELVNFITKLYKSEYNNGNVTSISNFLKTDKMYAQIILENYILDLKERDNFEGLIQYYGDLFRR